MKVQWQVTKNIDRERYYDFHRRRNSEFFADYVILTEVPINAELVRHLAEDGGLDFAKHSVSIIGLDSVDSLPHVFQLLNELRINFASVVDNDYFLPYLNDNLSDSRDVNGFPRYKREYKDTCLIEEMVPDAAAREQLLEYFSQTTRAPCSSWKPLTCFASVGPWTLISLAPIRRRTFYMVDWGCLPWRDRRQEFLLAEGSN